MDATSSCPSRPLRPASITLASAVLPASAPLALKWASRKVRHVPELPEVETVVRSLGPLVGRRIATAEFRNLRVLRGGDPDRMAARLAGRRIERVQRYGKFILASLDGGGYLMIHLGITGR